MRYIIMLLYLDKKEEFEKKLKKLTLTPPKWEEISIYQIPGHYDSIHLVIKDGYYGEFLLSDFDFYDKKTKNLSMAGMLFEKMISSCGKLSYQDFQEIHTNYKKIVINPLSSGDMNDDVKDWGDGFSINAPNIKPVNRKIKAPNPILFKKHISRLNCQLQNVFGIKERAFMLDKEKYVYISQFRLAKIDEDQVKNNASNVYKRIAIKRNSGT